MHALTLDQTISAAMQLPLEQQDMLINILSKRRIEIRRQEILTDANNSVRSFKNEQFKILSAEEAITELHDAFENDG